MDTYHDFDDFNVRVWNILQQHRGVRRAIKAKAIARALGYRDDRPVRKAIEELVADGALIGASIDGPHRGYFLIETEAELEMVRNVLRSRAVAIFQRDGNLRRAWQREHGQPIQPLLTGWEA